MWKILRTVAALSLILPRLALGEQGVCPAYSRTFGPKDDWNDIETFINTASQLPAGATARFRPGDYRVFNLLPVIGVLCIEGLGEEQGEQVTISAELAPTFVVAPGGVLTLRSVRTEGIEIRDKGVVYATELETTGPLAVGTGGIAQIENSTLSSSIVVNGFAQIHRSFIGEATNTGKLSLSNTKIVSVTNSVSGLLYLDQVSLQGNEAHKYGYCPSAWVSNEGAVSMRGSTIARNFGAECAVGIENFGYLEMLGSIVSDNAMYSPVDYSRTLGHDCLNYGEFVDLGYNLLGLPASESNKCVLTRPTSSEASAEFRLDFESGSIELGTGSPAIDRIPLELCGETDMLGRARMDGDGDGILACDAGALEYGYAAEELVVRTRPWWKAIGELDLSTENRLRIYVFSSESVDATQIPIESIEVEGFDEAARRGPHLVDINSDGLMDIRIWYRLDRMPPLSCGNHRHLFYAKTADAREVDGVLKFGASGCTP